MDATSSGKLECPPGNPGANESWDDVGNCDNNSTWLYDRLGPILQVSYNACKDVPHESAATKAEDCEKEPLAELIVARDH